MDIDIERLSVQLSGDIAPEEARRLDDLLGDALRETLRLRLSELAAAPAGYQVPSLSLPALQVRAGAGGAEIAEAVADALARALLREWSVR